MQNVVDFLQFLFSVTVGALAIVLVVVAIYLFFVMPLTAIFVNHDQISGLLQDAFAYSLRLRRETLDRLHQRSFRRSLKHLEKHENWLDAVTIVNTIRDMQLHGFEARVHSTHVNGENIGDVTICNPEDFARLLRSHLDAFIEQQRTPVGKATRGMVLERAVVTGEAGDSGQGSETVQNEAVRA